MEQAKVLTESEKKRELGPCLAIKDLNAVRTGGFRSQVPQLVEVSYKASSRY